MGPTREEVLKAERCDGFPNFQAIKGQNKGQKTGENIMENLRLKHSAEAT